MYVCTCLYIYMITVIYLSIYLSIYLYTEREIDSEAQGIRGDEGHLRRAPPPPCRLAAEVCAVSG